MKWEKPGSLDTGTSVLSMYLRQFHVGMFCICMGVLRGGFVFIIHRQTDIAGDDATLTCLLT